MKASNIKYFIIGCNRANETSILSQCCSILHFYLPSVGRFFIVEDRVAKLILQIVLLVG